MRRSIVLVAGGAVLLGAFFFLPAGRAVSQEIVEVLVRNWPESFRIQGPVEVTGGPLRRAALVEKLDLVVPPVSPRDTPRLFDAGVLLTDGYPAVVLSLAAQPRGQITREGEIGAVLVPDVEFVQQAFDEARLSLFPFEVVAKRNPGTAYFASDQPRYRVAFPRYRVLLYNTTDKSVTANLYVYLTE